jgi:hypothetical protein
VEGLFCSGYDRADLVGAIAERDSKIKGHAGHFVKGFLTVV